MISSSSDDLSLPDLYVLIGRVQFFLQHLEVSRPRCTDDHLAVSLFDPFIRGQDALETKTVFSDDVAYFADGARAVLYRNTDAAAAMTDAGDVHARAVDVTVRDNADELAALQHREAADIFVQHRHRGFLHRRITGRGDDVGFHDFLDPRLGQEVVKLIDIEGRGLRRTVFLDVSVRDDAFQLPVLENR